MLEAHKVLLQHFEDSSFEIGMRKNDATTTLNLELAFISRQIRGKDTLKTFRGNFIYTSLGLRRECGRASMVSRGGVGTRSSLGFTDRSGHY